MTISASKGISATFFMGIVERFLKKYPFPSTENRKSVITTVKGYKMNSPGKEEWNCNILRCGKCQGETCHFHKTHEEQAQSLEKVNERLRSLPEYQQEAIADKYYGGVKKW